MPFLTDSVIYKRQQYLEEAKKYVSQPIKIGDLWTIQYQDFPAHNIKEILPAKYKYIRRERAKILATIALRLMGYDENQILSALSQDKIFAVGKAECMLRIATNFLGFGKI